MRDDLVVKRNRLASRGHDRVSLKDHPQLARFRGDRRVHRSAKIQGQPRRVARVQLETDLYADIADE